MHTQLLIQRLTNASLITVGGNVDAGSAEAFAAAIEHDVPALSFGDRPIQIDLDNLELDDGSAVVEAVNALRGLMRLGAVVLHHAPQMLAHTLYKTGMLEDDRIRLVTPRVEEPTTI
jgi:anti-anti-sigma regulatory factor